jgi:hypothetical protein
MAQRSATWRNRGSGVEITFYQPAGKGTAAFLIFKTTGISESVRLPPAFAKLIVALLEAHKDDQEIIPAELCGWRKRGELADLIRQEDEWVLDPSTIGSSVSKIQRKIDDELPQSFPRVSLFDRRRGYGVRLAIDADDGQSGPTSRSNR